MKMNCVKKGTVSKHRKKRIINDILNNSDHVTNICVQKDDNNIENNQSYIKKKLSVPGNSCIYFSTPP